MAALPLLSFFPFNVSPDRRALLPDYETPVMMFMPQYRNSCDIYPDMVSLTVKFAAVQPKWLCVLLPQNSLPSRRWSSRERDGREATAEYHKPSLRNYDECLLGLKWDKLISKLYTDQSVKIGLAQGDTQSVNIGRVDRQGCGLSLILFNLYRFGYFKIGRKVARTVKYADYLVLLAKEEHAVAQLVEALRYKPDGLGFDSRWCHWNFSLT